MVPAGDAVDRADAEAEELRHGWIGAEHLVLALLRERSAAGESLRACGVEHGSYRREVEGLPATYLSARPPYWPYGKSVAFDAQQVLARAEGLAAGLGSTTVESEHILLSLLWARTSLVALALLERLGATRERILGELERRGVRLGVPPPAWPSWGPFRRISKAEFERLAPELRRQGVLYRYSEQDGDVLISTAESR
jgi:ATP-dependent Clp protease ATP-binding subunit ClpA